MPYRLTSTAAHRRRIIHQADMSIKLLIYAVPVLILSQCVNCIIDWLVG